jgi:hypothetical protein
VLAQTPALPTYGNAQAKKLGAAVPGNPAAQQQVMSSGLKADEKQQPVGVMSQPGSQPMAGGYGSAVPNAVNQGYMQPQNPPLQQVGAQPQYPQQASFGTGQPSYLAQQGATGQQGYSVVPPFNVTPAQAQNAGLPFTQISVNFGWFLTCFDAFWMVTEMQDPSRQLLYLLVAQELLRNNLRLILQH